MKHYLVIVEWRFKDNAEEHLQECYDSGMNADMQTIDIDDKEDH